MSRFYRALRQAHAPVAVVASVMCPGCQWSFRDAAALEVHKEKCAAAKALTLPKDNDAEGWTALAGRMKRAAIEAQARGLASEYEAGMRRSEACAEKAQAAKGAR